VVRARNSIWEARLLSLPKVYSPRRVVGERFSESASSAFRAETRGACIMGNRRASDQMNITGENRDNMEIRFTPSEGKSGFLRNWIHLAKTIARALTLTVVFNGPQMIAAVGDLYEADFGSGSVFRFTPAGVKTTFATGLGNPAGLAFDAQGNLFVGNNAGTIIKITPAGAKTVFASGLNMPFGVAFDPNGNLFEADEGSGSIFKFTPAGVKTTFATGLSSPAGLAFDQSGNLFVSEFTAGRIDKIAPNGASVIFASGLSFPDGLFVTPSGNLLECNSGSGHVFSFTPAGVRTTFASGFVQNSGVIADARGNTFVTQNSAGTITKIASDGTRTTFASGLFNPQYLAFEPAVGSALFGNVSTRAFVQTGNNVMIGGFIITGTGQKTVIVRAIGPSLAQHGIPNPLQNPTLELHDHTGALIASNDDWMNAPNRQAIINSGLAPSNNLESAILTSLNPGSYTAIVSGVNSTTGIALVEGYDLDQSAPSKFGNISTRALVQTGNNVMIGGFIITGSGQKRVIVRAIGPSLAQHGIANPLLDPTLELHNGNGAIIAFNDNWRDTQQSEIEATGLQPTDNRESAIVTMLSPGNYTAIVRGRNSTTGVALVEVYGLN
jgi:sugar lactone lactonase YvrE